MPNVTGDNLTFNIDSISDNQILVYDAAQGIFVAQDSLVANANVAISGALNVGAPWCWCIFCKRWRVFKI